MFRNTHMKNNYNVLIADDHQIVIDGLKSLLKDSPFAIVKEALNGQHAMDILQTNPNDIDVLITDISMPLLDGISLCKTVKHTYPHMKVLILSMYSSIPMVKEAIAAEADGFMLKNAGKDELQNALHRIVNDGTYYSEELLPVIYGQIKKEQASADKLQNLTIREREILKLILKEYTSDEIAERLFISKKTVDNHRAHLLEKTNSKSTIGLVKFAIKNGMEAQ